MSIHSEMTDGFAQRRYSLPNPAAVISSTCISASHPKRESIRHKSFREAWRGFKNMFHTAVLGITIYM